MAKKLGKFLVIGAIAGIGAAGVYHYLQTKDKDLKDLDDFDDLDDDDDDIERSYLNLDNASSDDDTEIIKGDDAADVESSATGGTSEDFFNDNEKD